MVCGAAFTDLLAMKKLLALSSAVSIAITAYCLLEYQLPHAQYTKVLAELKMAGVNDKETIERIRRSILGVQTTWKPLLALALSENILLLALTVRAMSKKEIQAG
jgi:hypothetical protein